MEPQDELARRIAAYVATQVQPQFREAMTRAVCMTVATLMADQTFTNELVIVKALREENQWLRTNYHILKQMMDKVGVKQRSAPKKRSTGPRKPPVKRAGSSTPRAKAASPQRPRKSAPNSSFRQGFNEMRG